MKPQCCNPNAPLEKCVACGNIVYTCEKQELNEEDTSNNYCCPVHGKGVETLLGWFCSEECYFKVF